MFLSRIKYCNQTRRLFKYLLQLTIPGIVSVHQWLQIFLSPGIEPGNLIRSTLIRSPPGAVFFKIKLHCNITKHSRKYSNVPPALLLTAATSITTKTDKENGNDKLKSRNLRQLYFWIFVASVGYVSSCCLWFRLFGILSP